MTKNKVWGIFRYKDIQTILTDYRNFSSDIQKLVSIQQEQEIQKSRELRDHKKKRRLLRSSLLTSDPPRHSQLRRVIYQLLVQTQYTNSNHELNKSAMI
jgi:cytochrome P450